MEAIKKWTNPPSTVHVSACNYTAHHEELFMHALHMLSKHNSAWALLKKVHHGINNNMNHISSENLDINRGGPNISYI